MAGYEDTRQMIINTLTNRLAGTEIQPEDHQEFALAITDYVRGVELLSGNAFIGFAEANTTPVQSDKGQCFYISTVRPGQTVNFVNFIDSNGNSISVSSPGGKMSLVTLIWNTQYWSSQVTTIDTNWSIAQQSGSSESMVMSQKAVTDAIATKEDVDNKVTSINADADDAHYPSAKAVKDLIDSQTFPIINNLTEGGEESALSAEMGKELNLDKISKESATTSQYPELTGVGFKENVWYADGSQLKSNSATFTLFVPVEAGERLTVTGIYNITVYPVSSTIPSAVGDNADFPNDGTINGNEITYQHAGYAWLQSTGTIRVTKNKGLIVANKTDGIIPPIENTTSYLDGQFITKETMQNGDIMPSLYALITPSRNLLDPASFDPISYINTSNGQVMKRDGNYGIVVVRNVVLNGSFCFSASQQLLPIDSMFNGISIQPSAYEKNNTIYAALTGSNFGNIKGKGDQLNFTMLPEYNGWKITANIEFPCDIYIGVGHRGASTNMQFEKGDSPTNFVSYGEKIVGTDWSPQISALSQSVVALQAQIDNVKSVPSRWTGCRYVACGDSITDENYSPTTKYCTLLNNALATTSYLNAGSSGATLCTVHTNNFVNKLRTLDLTAFDLMTIMLGVNDKGWNAPMGTIDGSDTGTFYGAWNDVINYIITANPRLKVVLLTPFNTGSSSVNELGLNVKDYADAILAIGTKYSIPVVDCFRNAGICPNNWGTYTLDDLHPNDLGHEWVAGYIIAQVKNL